MPGRASGDWRRRAPSLWVLASLLLGACGGSSGADPRSGADPEDSSTASDGAEGSSTQAKAKGAPVCRVEPLPPAPAPPPPLPAGACKAVPGNVQAGVREALTKSYDPPAPGAKLVAKFDCDPLGRPVEVLYERGNEYRLTLELVRLQRRGGRIQALRIASPSYRSDSGGAVRVERGEIEESALDEDLPALRGSLLAKLEEKVPPNATRSASFSPESLHDRVRIQDEGGRVIDRGFTGYHSKDMQVDSVPVIVAADSVRLLVKRIHWQAAPVDADVRSFFVERFVSGSSQSSTAWWVYECLVRLSGQVGTPALIPKLIELAQAEASDDAAVGRRSQQAVNALASLTGIAAPRDEDGKPVPTKEAAAEYARACKQ